MCVIIDNNVVGEVFTKNEAEKLAPAREFFRCISARRYPVVAGGKLLTGELNGNERFKRWFQQARLSGRGKLISNDAVIAETRKIEHRGGYESDDPHVLALARVSGARLLYTNDKDLQQDFKNRKLISGPSGKIYTTLSDNDKRLRRAHKDLLGRTDLCSNT